MQCRYLFLAGLLFGSAVHASGDFSFTPSARLQVDTGMAPGEDFTDGEVIRRLWAGGSGKLGGDWTYSVIGGQSGDVTAIQDAWLRHENWLILGQHKEHDGLESAASNLTSLSWNAQAPSLPSARGAILASA